MTVMTRHFYAHCNGCGWDAHTPLFAHIRSRSEAHASDCANPAIEVDIGIFRDEKTPAVQQHDEGHSIHLSAGTNAKSSNLAVVGVSVNRD